MCPRPLVQEVVNLGFHLGVWACGSPALPCCPRGFYFWPGRKGCGDCWGIPGGQSALEWGSICPMCPPLPTPTLSIPHTHACTHMATHKCIMHQMKVHSAFSALSLRSIWDPGAGYHRKVYYLRSIQLNSVLLLKHSNFKDSFVAWMKSRWKLYRKVINHKRIADMECT